jgi:hypothetical protein
MKAIREEYSEKGVEGFYRECGGEYGNPHFPQIRELLIWLVIITPHKRPQLEKLDGVKLVFEDYALTERGKKVRLREFRSIVDCPKGMPFRSEGFLGKGILWIGMIRPNRQIRKITCHPVLELFILNHQPVFSATPTSLHSVPRRGRRGQTDDYWTDDYWTDDYWTDDC